MDIGKDADARRRLDSLSKAEEAVLQEALTVDPVKAIADRLSLSEATIRSHLSAIYAKLDADSRAHLIARYFDTEAYRLSSDRAAVREMAARRNRSRARLAGAAGAVAVLLILGGLVLRSVGSGDVVSLQEAKERIADGAVAELAYTDSKLYVLEHDGRRLVVNDIAITDAISLAGQNSTDLTVLPYDPPWLESVVLVLPFFGLAAALVTLLLIGRRLRRGTAAAA